MDIRRLSYFIRVAELGSLNATAEEVNLSQPSLSRQIRLLEEELGVRLFTRQRNGMELTRQGLELRLRIAGPLRQLELGLQDIKSQAARTGGSVVVGMPSSVIYVLASSLVRRIKMAAPNISLHITEGLTGSLPHSVESGEVDIALLDGPAGKWNCTIEDLLVERMMLVGSSESGLSMDRPIKVEELHDLPLILSNIHQDRGNYRSVIEKFASHPEGVPRAVVDADTLLLKKSYAEAGIGYAILPYSAFSQEVESGKLKCAPVCDPEISRHLLLCIHEGGQYPRAVQTVRKLILEEILSLKKSGKWNAELLFDMAETLS